MKQKLFSFLKVFIPFSLILFLIQWFLINYLFDTDLYYSTVSVYLFHFISTLLVYSLVLWVYKNFREKAGFAFMGGGLFKMMAAVLFLLPMLLSGDPGFNDVVAFFIPYFLFLSFETLFAVRLIKG